MHGLMSFILYWQCNLYSRIYTENNRGPVPALVLRKIAESVNCSQLSHESLLKSHEEHYNGMYKEVKTHSPSVHNAPC